MSGPEDVDVVAGQVWWARPSPSVGREQAGRRPVVIVSGAFFNTTVTTLALAVPITTTDRGWSNHIPLGRMREPSWAMTEQVRALSRARLDSLITLTTPAELDAIRAWIVGYFAD